MLKSAFSDPHSVVFRVWNQLIALLIFVSCIVLALDSIPEVAKAYEYSFSVIEWFSVAIFTIDYLGHMTFSEKNGDMPSRCGALLICFRSCLLT
jgi:hypothetical protein